MTLLEAVGYCWFWWCFITKVWSVDHIIIVIYINGVCYRGSSEMCQIHVQWSHFSGLLVTVDFDDSFDTKVWSVDQWKLVLAKSLICSILNFEISCCIFECCPYFRLYNVLLKKFPWFYKNEPVWRISHTALLLLLTFSCFFWHSIAHIAHLQHFCILCTRPKSCFGGLNERWAATLFSIYPIF